MKMPVDVIMPSNNIEKLDETLLLLTKVSLSLGNTTTNVASYPLSRNENQNNGTQSPVPGGFELPNESSFDPEVLYARVFKLHRSGRVSKKSPSRPGFPTANRNYLLHSTDPAHDPLAPHSKTSPFHGNRSPASMPSSPYKVMTAEEILQVEAEDKLQKRLAEEADLGKKLAEQRRVTEENDLWLKNQAGMNVAKDNAEDDAEHLYHTPEDVRRKRNESKAPQIPYVPPPQTPYVPPPQPTTNAIAPPPPTLKCEDVRPTPTMKLNRDNDNVYRDVMNVVKSVFHSNKEIMNSRPDDIFLLVKDIGKALKDLSNSLEHELPSLPVDYHREIDMAQKTTNKDLAQIINQTKLVKKFYVTTQVNEYKKYLMAANQVLAMDAKSLLDVVDKARSFNNQQSEDAESRGREPSISSDRVDE